MAPKSKGKGKQEEVAEPDVWAQCDSCQKWRRLPPGTQISETEPWYCHLNPDPKHSSCSDPEEAWGANEVDQQDDQPSRSGKGRGRGGSKSLRKEALAKPATQQASTLLPPGSLPDGFGGDGVLPNGVAPMAMATPGALSQLPLGSQQLLPPGGPAASPGGPSAGPGAPGLPGAAAPSAAPEELSKRKRKPVDRDLPYDDAPKRRRKVQMQGSGPPGGKVFPSLEEELRQLAGACRRLMANGGSWEAPRPPKLLTSAQMQVPSWVWTGLHHFVPEAARIAALAVETFTAAEYFSDPKQQDQQGTLSRSGSGSGVLMSALKQASEGQGQGDSKAGAGAGSGSSSHQQQGGAGLQQEAILRVAMSTAAALALPKTEALLASLPSSVPAAPSGRASGPGAAGPGISRAGQQAAAAGPSGSNRGPGATKSTSAPVVSQMLRPGMAAPSTGQPGGYPAPGSSAPGQQQQQQPQGQALPGPSQGMPAWQAGQQGGAMHVQQQQAGMPPTFAPSSATIPTVMPKLPGAGPGAPQVRPAAPGSGGVPGLLPQMPGAGPGMSLSQVSSAMGLGAAMAAAGAAGSAPVLPAAASMQLLNIVANLTPHQLQQVIAQLPEQTRQLVMQLARPPGLGTGAQMQGQQGQGQAPHMQQQLLGQALGAGGLPGAVPYSQGLPAGQLQQAQMQGGSRGPGPQAAAGAINHMALAQQQQQQQQAGRLPPGMAWHPGMAGLMPNGQQMLPSGQWPGAGGGLPAGFPGVMPGGPTDQGMGLAAAGGVLGSGESNGAGQSATANGS